MVGASVLEVVSVGVSEVAASEGGVVCCSIVRAVPICVVSGG